MDEEFKAVFEKLQDEAIQIQYTWSIYRSLYASGDENVAFLNKYGSNFFSLAQSLLIENISLGLSRLTDPNRTRDNENLSLKQIHVHADKHSHFDLLQLITPLYEKLHEKCLQFRGLRNKRIAHADLQQAMRIEGSSLPMISYQDIENALEALSNYLNAVERFYFKSETGYHFVTGPFGTGGESVIRALQMAEKYEGSQKLT